MTTPSTAPVTVVSPSPSYPPSPLTTTSPEVKKAPFSALVSVSSTSPPPSTSSSSGASRDIEIFQFDELMATPSNVLKVKTWSMGRKQDIDASIISLIDHLTSDEQLIILGILFRNGGNPNMYVNMPKYEVTIHLIGYVFIHFMDREVQDLSRVDMIINLIINAGGNINVSVYKGEARGKDVKTWLSMNNYQINDSDILNRDSSIVLDKEDLYSKELVLANEQVTLAIRSHSNKIIKKCSLIRIQPSEYLMDHPWIVDSVKYLNSESFAFFIDQQGFDVSYLQMNNIISAINSYDNAGDLSSSGELLLMLLAAIKLGTRLDLEQYTLVAKYSDQIRKVYETPYWRKTCSSKSVYIDPDLKKLALILDIPLDSSKFGMCSDLKTLSEGDHFKLKESDIKKRTSELSARLSKPQEYGLSGLSCSNKETIDPMSFSDTNVSSYRDESGKVWCFSGYTYSDLISSELNPYTKEKLPEHFIGEISRKVALYGEPGFPEELKMTFGDGLKSLSVKDEITNSESDRYVTVLNQLLLVNGIDPSRINSLTPLGMEQVLAQLGVTYNLKVLSPKHASYTFSRILVTLTQKYNVTVFKVIKTI